MAFTNEVKLSASERMALEIKKEEQQAKDRKERADGFSFLWLKKSESRVIYFLSDFDDVLEMQVHNAFQKIKETPCYAQYGFACPYCANEDKDISRIHTLHYWPVYSREIDRSSGKIKFVEKTDKLHWFGHERKMSTPIQSLLTHFSLHGDITSTLFLYENKIENNRSVYTLTPFGTPPTKVPDHVVPKIEDLLKAKANFSSDLRSMIRERENGSQDLVDEANGLMMEEYESPKSNVTPLQRPSKNSLLETEDEELTDEEKELEKAFKLMN